MVNFWNSGDRSVPTARTRDPKRFDLVLAAFKYVWSKNDQQRFGQLVYNLCRDENGKFDEKKLMFIEDEAFLTKLISYD